MSVIGFGHASYIITIPGSKSHNPRMLACKRIYGFETRQNMRKKRDVSPADSEYFAELWKHEVRNNPRGIVYEFVEIRRSQKI